MDEPWHTSLLLNGLVVLTDFSLFPSVVLLEEAAWAARWLQSYIYLSRVEDSHDSYANAEDDDDVQN